MVLFIEDCEIIINFNQSKHFKKLLHLSSNLNVQTKNLNDMKRFLFTALFSIFFTTVINAQPPAGDANVGDVYGADITVDKNVSAKELKSMLQAGPIQANITGEVVEVCANKGCWMKLKLEDESVVTVKMKDYGFFVPTKLTGKRVVVTGKIEMATTSVAELKHFAEDAKQPQSEIDKITEPKTEVKIMASGIKVII